VTAVADCLDLIVEGLADVDTAWSIGTFGAIAEFSRDVGEAAIQDSNAEAAWVVTARGGIRIEAHESTRPIATESLTAQSWNQRVALCLPESACAMSGGRVLAEIGAIKMHCAKRIVARCSSIQGSVHCNWMRACAPATQP
jgi:hypothetical protein